jgi:rare lipoprotein A
MPGMRAAIVLALVFLSGCTSVSLQSTVEDRPAQRTNAKPATPPAASSASASAPTPAAPAAAGKGRGGYYLDDGPEEQVPAGLLDTPDAEPKVEPFAKGPSRPYSIFDKTYTPITDYRPFVQRGTGSWYGKKFHGQRTASGEIYNMYKMTAAHPTLPIPSYARVTNLRNGKQVIVRVNDRGPFHSERIIDLSYTAALKLGYINGGSSELEVERLLPDEIARINAKATAKTNAPASPESKPADVPASDPIASIVKPENAAPVAAAPGTYFLQFGAYAQSPNALAMRERLLSGWPQDLPPPAVVQNQGLFRLHSGPFSSREAASQAARQLQDRAQIRTTIVQK